MHHSRPKNLNLLTIRFPLPAIISILHRLSGVFLFILIPFILWALGASLTLSGFDAIHQCLSHPLMKTLVWLILVPFCYHFVAGVRHLLSDIHIGDTLKSGRLGAVLTLIVSFFIVILVGIWLW